MSKTLEFVLWLYPVWVILNIMNNKRKRQETRLFYIVTCLLSAALLDGLIFCVISAFKVLL